MRVGRELSPALLGDSSPPFQATHVQPEVPAGMRQPPAHMRLRALLSYVASYAEVIEAELLASSPAPAATDGEILFANPRIVTGSWVGLMAADTTR